MATEYIVGIVTVSDRCSAGQAEDESGKRLRSMVAASFNASITATTVPDEFAQIQAELVRLADVVKAHLILTTGGTGFAQRDITPEATRAVIEREAPQLSLAMSLASFKSTNYAALSRAVCGIRQHTLIVNMPGSPKAVEECFMAIRDVLGHGIDLINGFERTGGGGGGPHHGGGCSGRTGARCSGRIGTGSDSDRHSPYPMVAVGEALKIVLREVPRILFDATLYMSHHDAPPFRASLKDGYAVRVDAMAFEPVLRVLGTIDAGDAVQTWHFAPHECYKINTGAAVPEHANAIIQVEDTEVLDRRSDGREKTIHVRSGKPREGQDIRQIGSDMPRGHRLFSSPSFPGAVALKTLLASDGDANAAVPHDRVKVCILSTGKELTTPGEHLEPGKIFDSNTTMLMTLLNEHGFRSVVTVRVGDSLDEMKRALQRQSAAADFLVFSGSVSMGDKDFLKQALSESNYHIHFGRVNMKPGKPMTFATRKGGVHNRESFVFGLPGNPVSAYVTFHLFVLPALRQRCDHNADTLSLPLIPVELQNESIELDERPEYARATVSMRRGRFLAEITENQASSTLVSIVNADVLLHLPARTLAQPSLKAGTPLMASALKLHFISRYMD